MTRRLFGTLLLAVASGRGADGDGEVRLSVMVEDFADTPAKLLANGEQQASYLVERAGVAIDWYHRGGTPTPDLVMRLVNSVGGQLYRSPVLGWAYLPERRATIVLDRVQVCAGESGLTSAVLLGHVIAHEVAHLLLGLQSHQDWGVMRANWSRADLATMSKQWLIFAREDRDRMRRAAASLRARVVARAAPSPSGDAGTQ
jgi:hypothetical protein